MVKETDITQERIKEKEISDGVRGLIRELLGEDVRIGEIPQLGGSLLVSEGPDNDKKIMGVDGLSYRVTVYNSSYEEKARSIAERYEELVGKEVIFETDYSGLN